MAEIVGGDLYRLWRVSEVHLPRIADVYYDAGRALGGARGDDTGAFRSNTSVGSGAATYSAGAAAWGALRDELLRMYASTGGTCLTAAEGIRRARQAYVDADLASADALSQYLADPTNHDPKDPASNPPREGDDDYPGEPVMP